MTDYPRTEYRDGMRIEWDVPIEMDDGVTVRCDVFLPQEDGEYPVIMSYGPYGKWLHFDQIYEEQLEAMYRDFPETNADTTGKYLTWETVDPEKWVPDGYAVVRVDSRGAGRSEGDLDVWSHREARDFAACIEWAGEADWSNGKVGLNGISYYAMNQWQAAALQPDHLEAICPWEGAADFYRDLGHHGGIFCTFANGWYERQVVSVQHGLGSNGYQSPLTGDWVSGPETLSTEELHANRADITEDYRSNKLATDEYWASRNFDWDDVEVPILSPANWGGHGLHPRGNFEGYTQPASDQRWLEVHGVEHWSHFYSGYGLDLQKRFFGHFLKGEDTGWEDQPPVQLQVRHPDETFVERHEDDWPIPRTEWTEYYLDAHENRLSTDQPDSAGSVTYDALGDGVTFVTPPLAEQTEVTGPMAAKLFVESDTEDTDVFVVVRLFSPDFEEEVFVGAVDAHKPIAFGWLRASHRKLDEEKSEPYRPYHTHDEVQPLEPGEVYELDVEVWPSCVVAPEGWRLGVSVRGKDYVYPGDIESDMATFEGVFTGVGPFRHDDGIDRDPDVYGGDVTVHTGPDHPSHVLFPIVPEE